MSAGSEIILQIEGLDLDVIPRGEKSEKKFTFTALPRNELHCLTNCPGGELPTGCPLTGEIIKNSMGWTIKTAAEKIDGQLKNAYCIPIDIPSILEKFK